MEEKIMPVEEILHEDEFTGRVEILRELEEWIQQIGRVGAGSTALIAPRRMGKTVLLDRLVNTIFFKPEYKVAPFYIKFRREEITLRKFLLFYATEFFRQYISYCLQDPFLYQRTDIEIQELLEIKSEHKAIVHAQMYIGYFLKRYNNNDQEDVRNHWDEFIKFPEKIASFTGTRVAIIIDEFQDMKFYVFDSTEEEMKKFKSEAKEDMSWGAIDLTATYDRQALSRKAPMLVSGSAVTLIFRTVMGGPLGGRFGFKYLRPLSIDDGATLMINLIGLYMPGSVISPENAVYASTQVTGHPYYLYCLATSDCPQKMVTNTEDIDRVIQYEIENGKIYGFWQTHFDENREYINNDTDNETGKKIIYYFTKYNNQPVQIDELARKINIGKKEVEAKIEKLYLADLVYKSEFKYFTFNDICLMRFIQHRFEHELSGIEKIDLSEQGKYNILKGRFLELVVQQIMAKFNGEEVDGSLFGRRGIIKVPKFSFADARFVKGESTDQFQIDVFAMNNESGLVWLSECKYRLSKIGMDTVKKVEGAFEAFKLQQQNENRPPKQVQLWLVSTGGFTDEVTQYIKEFDHIYYSDYNGINGLFRKYGGGFDIPVFYKD
ncbi:MAG: hypothetical protein Q7J78_03765 [Clostridiales bacterium]|nr:hypothetical protein [Clostridiales bacterium]